MDSSMYSETWYAWATPKGIRPGPWLGRNMNTTCGTCGRPARATDSRNLVRCSANHLTVANVAAYVAEADAKIAAAGRCSEHPAYDADYCPVCGTARVIGGPVR